MSKRDKANRRLTGFIEQFRLESNACTATESIHSDLRDIGEQCGTNRGHHSWFGKDYVPKVAMSTPAIKADRVTLWFQIGSIENLIRLRLMKLG
ncbi:hypothetical protein HGD83_01080 [Alteromonadaceae bacterium A_SAG8]|nr:hypothetical protein [Alteromonadaceae bacterium A_SAG8]